MKISLALRQFLEHLEIERGRSIKTVENYERYISRFINHTNVKTVSQIDEEMVREYRMWLNRQNTKEGTLKLVTQNYYLIALRGFFKFLNARGYSTIGPESILLAKTPMRDIDLLTPSELSRLLNAPGDSTLTALRDTAILHTLFSTGLRVSELCSLPRHIDSTREDITVRGKGEKIRIVYFSPEAKKHLKKYLSKRTDTEEALFIPLTNKGTYSEQEGRRLTPRSVERIVSKYARAAGISKKVTPHVIRHSFATDLLRNGADIRSVQELLGHANIATTQIYTHITNRQLKEIHQKFHNRK